MFFLSSYKPTIFLAMRCCGIVSYRTSHIYNMEKLYNVCIRLNKNAPSNEYIANGYRVLLCGLVENIRLFYYIPHLSDGNISTNFGFK